MRNSKTELSEAVVTLAKWILALAGGAMISFMAGCGNNTRNVQNQPAPASSSVSIAFQPAPTESVSLSATTTLTAVVSNDPASAGVDWSLLCSHNSNCGTLSPLHTASGAPATYTPPASISGNNQSVTIEAFATADHSQNVVTPITVTGFASTLKGPYVFLIQGRDATGAFHWPGVIVVMGTGGSTSEDK